MLMLPLSLFQDIVYIPGMWIKVAVTSGTALPPGDYGELWLTLPNVALTDSPCGMVTVRALPGLGVPGSESHGKGKGGFPWRNGLCSASSTSPARRRHLLSQAKLNGVRGVEERCFTIPFLCTRLKSQVLGSL